ncbi:MAG: hypothetical protein MZV65_48000 [Chromatiales bacterium]|nr:hypothetical protein [Chromatiales bacterium]
MRTMATRCRWAPGSASSRSPAWSARAASASSTSPTTTRCSARVALKEYMPLGAGRAHPAASTRVGALASATRETFEAGLQELHQRGAAAGAVRPPLAGQGVPLLGGQRHRLHGDAVLRGRHAQAGAQGACGEPPDEAWLRRAAGASCSTRSRSSTREHCFHRDIAPDNILLLEGRAGRCCSTSAPRGASSAT